MRQVGCAAMFLLFSSVHDPLQSKHLRKIAETLTGFFLLGYTYILNNSPEDKRAFLLHVPGGDWARYVFTLVLAAGAISFFSGHFLHDISIALIVMFAMLTLLIDCDTGYWVENKGMHLWNQLRLICDNFNIIIGFSMVFMKFDNKIKVD